jgi:hypothetical protein
VSELRAPQQPGHSANYQPQVSPSSAAASGVPSYAAVIPLIFAGVGLLLLFLVLVWVLFGPQDFTERLIAFGVAAALMVWMISVLDSAQRRSFERLRAKMELQRELAVAEALAEERNRLLDQFMGTFVIKVHGTAGDFIPYPTPMAFNLTTPGGAPPPRTIDLSDRHDDQPSATGWGR